MFYQINHTVTPHHGGNIAPCRSFPSNDLCCRSVVDLRTIDSVSSNGDHNYINIPAWGAYCTDSSVVYLVGCTGCLNSYIGSTGRPVRQRFAEHASTDPTSPVYKHNLICAGELWFTILVLMRGATPDERYRAEYALWALLRPTLNTRAPQRNPDGPGEV